MVLNPPRPRDPSVAVLCDPSSGCAVSAVPPPELTHGNGALFRLSTHHCSVLGHELSAQGVRTGVIHADADLRADQVRAPREVDELVAAGPAGETRSTVRFVVRVGVVVA